MFPLNFIPGMSTALVCQATSSSSSTGALNAMLLQAAFILLCALVCVRRTDSRPLEAVAV